jgi:hypothetical protein
VSDHTTPEVSRTRWQGFLDHALNAFTWLACVMGVPLAVAGLVWHNFGVALSGFVPAMNDEVWYWHEALTFATAGFHGGYYTQGEQTNPSGLTPFGPHGPGFAVLYGLPSWAFGWHPHSPVVLNLAFIGAAAWWCVARADASAARAALLAMVLATFWPLLLWAPTAMQESLHHAGAIALAGCVAGVIGGRGGRLARWGGWLLLPVLAFVRPSWLVMLPIWALVASWRQSPAARVGSVGAAVVAVVVVFAAYNRTAAPFVPPFFFLRVAGAGVGLEALAANVTANLRMAASLADYKPMEVVLRLQYWLWLPASLAGALLARRASNRAAAHLLTGFASVAAALAVMLILYTLTNQAEHRVLSAFLLFAAVLAALAPGRVGAALAVALVVSNLATTRLFTAAFREERQANFRWDARGYRELTQALAGRVVYHPGEPRWCNTLLTSQFPPFFLVVPGGIGLSVVREPDQMATGPKSKYLLIDDRAKAYFRAPLRVQPLATLPYGTLYLNLDAGCR